MKKYKRLSDKKFKEIIQDRNMNSVVCKCGHRVYINPPRKYEVCIFCGTKHISPKDNFKNKLKNLLGEKKA